MDNAELDSAVKTNDYAAFVESAPEQLLNKVDSEEAFNEFAAQKAEMDVLHRETQANILAAVQTNNYDAFQKVTEAMKAKMDELHADDDNGFGMKGRPELTAEQEAEFGTRQQEMFDKMVTYYEENGELPEQKMWGHGMFGFGKGGMKGHHGGGCDKDGDLEDEDSTTTTDTVEDEKVVE